MEIENNDLRGHWKSKDENFNFSFYPQNSNDKDFKCVITVNNETIHHGEIDIVKDDFNNECILNADDSIFTIKQYNLNDNFMNIENDQYGSFDLHKL